MTGNSDHRKIWNAGFHAGVQRERDAMNQAKIDRKVNSLNGIARKVFEAVPKQESWTINQVMQEMKRCGSPNPDRHVVAGSLNHMLANGIVIEPMPGAFRQVTPGNAPTHDPVPTVVDQNPPPAKPATAKSADNGDLLDRFARISSKLNSIAAQMKDVVDEVGSISLEAIEAIESAEKKTGQLKQLQELLKGLTNE